MTVEQTAEYIRALGRHYNWNQADAYADVFAENEIWGRLLPMLTLESLKTELEVEELDHRLKIMMAIGCLFPSMTIPMESEQWESPSVHSCTMASSPWASMMNISPRPNSEQMEE